MDLLKLAQEYGLRPKRKASTYGGEYASNCPSCGGTDRFLIWPAQERYWCRQCYKAGNTFTFHREFLNLAYYRKQNNFQRGCHTFSKSKKYELSVTEQWEKQAVEFVNAHSQRLFLDRKAMEKIQRRHLSLDTLEACQIGWHSVHRYDSRERWGLSEKDDGGRATFFIPPGIIIPSILSGKITRLNIRRSDWNYKSRFGKYYVIPGSQKCFSVFGYSPIKPLVLVEAELDAMLIWQECGDLCGAIATGGASKRPDMLSSLLLQKAPLILFAMDFDEAGKKAFQFWKGSFPKLHAWPVPFAKAPSDAFKRGLDLRKWISHGIDN